MALSTGTRRTIHSDLVRLYLPAALCFFVLNVTNVTLLGMLKKHGVLYGADPNQPANLEKTVRFFLVPAKSFVFFLCTAVLAFPLAQPCFKRLAAGLTKLHVLRSFGSLAISLALTATLAPTNFGRLYARISTDPFNQGVDQLYRRLLLPGLAYLYHVNGFLYVFLFWAVVVVAALAVKFFLLCRGVELTILEEVSLLTVGVFAASFQVPGYPEIVVFLLAIVALIEFELDRGLTRKQLIAFALALMAHEACAVIIFAPIVLFLFSRRAWPPCIAIATIYGVALLSNFSFDLAVPLRLQATVGELPAHAYFWLSPSTVLLAAAFSFKLLWLLVPAGIYFQFKVKPAYACFILCGFALALASTYIAVDYTRLVGFATIPIIFCFIQVRQHLPARLLQAVMALNFLVPSFYVGGNCGLVTCRGLYYLAYKAVFKLPAPAF